MERSLCVDGLVLNDAKQNKVPKALSLGLPPQTMNQGIAERALQIPHLGSRKEFADHPGLTMAN